jgi:signal transduction histidine kinase
MSLLGRREPLGKPAFVFNVAVGLLGIALLGVATWTWAPVGPHAPLSLSLTFLLVFVAARWLRFDVSPELNITASVIVPLQIAAILLLGPVLTAWIALPAFFAEVMKERALSGVTGARRRAVLGIIAFNLGMEALVILAAGAAWQATGFDVLVPSLPADVPALLVTFLVFKAVNEVLMAAAHWMRGVGVREYLVGARTTFIIETLTLPLAVLLVVIHYGLDKWTFYLFLLGVGVNAVLVRNLTRTGAQLKQANAALNHANADLQRRVREIEALVEIGKAISADIEADRLLDTIYRRCADLLVANHFFVALYTEGSRSLRIALEMIGGEPRAAKEIPLGEGLTSHVIVSRRPLLVRDLELERDALPVAPLLIDDRPNKSWLGVPMVARGEVVGAIVLQDREANAYDDDDARVLAAIASQAAISVKNARLHQEALHALRVEAENRELKRINAKKSDFVNMVAHQFRTPLTTVIGYANLLVERLERQGSENVPDLARHLRMVQSEAKRLADMVEELLNLSRIRSGRLPLTQQRFDVDQLVRETLAAHQLLAERRRLSLVAERVPGTGAADGTLPVVQGDSNFVRQAVGNLLAIAIKYSPEGSRVLVRCTARENDALVEVVDEGPGVPPEDLERIFDEFYRAAGKTAEQPGSGLGLSICRGIVEAHGGRTWAERRGPGTAFCLTLPLAPALGAADDDHPPVPMARAVGGP